MAAQFVCGFGMHHEDRNSERTQTALLPTFVHSLWSDEKYAIEQWLSTHRRDPMTNQVLKSKLLIPNHSLRKQIECFIEEHGLRPRSTKSSPFKYLLRVLRLHIEQRKGMHSATSTLRKYLYLFVGDDAAPSGYEKVLRRFLEEWDLYLAEVQGKWVDVMASTIYIQTKIREFYQNHFDGDGDGDGDDGQSVGELFAVHIVRALIAVKTSLREIVGLELKLLFLMEFLLDNVSRSAFSRKQRPRPLPSASDGDEEEKALNDDDLDEESDSENGFEGDLAAFGMVAGVIMAANACTSTGAAVGSAAGPAGTMFGAAVGLYVGAIAGTAPSMLYALYVEERKMKEQERDRLWKGVYAQLKRHHLWIGREREQFALCDRILVQCMESIAHCVDQQENGNGKAVPTVDADNGDVDWVYESVDEQLLDVWQCDISRITPFLQQCLSKAD